MPAKPKTSAAPVAAATAAARNGLSALGEGRRRVIVERVTPELDAGRYPIKRVVGDLVTVECDAFADGHDAIALSVRYRGPHDQTWHDIPMRHVVNDRWQGQFQVETIGTYHYTVMAWMDRFGTWEHALHKRVAAEQDVRVDLLIGAELVAEAANHAPAEHALTLHEFEQGLRNGDAEMGFSPELARLMGLYLPRRYATFYERELALTVDRPLARCSAWYEIFPRSASFEPGRHGTFRDVINWLPYISELGFDILYLTPIHPIGQTFRKGKDNRPTAQPGEPGSPYAIGGAEGGHFDVHPELGTLEDFRALVAAARAHGLEVALDNAFQVSPDHPYVQEHAQWFRARPDGTIQYAENPPKKYQDIYPFDFETEDWEALWYELKRYFEFWIEQGVKIFRVDNPHTKSFRFWEWCIAELKRDHPDLIMLSEAFTRPKVMYNLAKLGFTQSYTYFTWRTAKWELTQYMTELTQSEAKEFFRPNFWPNTHDILTPQFYPGHRATFLARAALAATMAANWGIYGPAYELLLHTPVQGREEYCDNEKYEIRHWDLNAPQSIKGFIAALNQARRNHAALQTNEGLRFHRVEIDFAEHEQLIAYSKATADLSDLVLMVVNLDPLNRQAGWVQIPTAEWGLSASYRVRDLLTGMVYQWRGEFNYVELSPELPVHLLVIERPNPTSLPVIGDYA
ncbi:MAG: alpha-1,4-glucan--maltose-1-phosphate maltosyltransferase [Oscillochloridaceae bacterium umkhey_bin13]